MLCACMELELPTRRAAHGLTDSPVWSTTKDFSPKGGPKDAVAKFDGDGIVFPEPWRWSGEDRGRIYDFGWFDHILAWNIYELHNYI